MLEKIILVGEKLRRAEWKEKFPDIELLEEGLTPPSYDILKKADLVFDLNLDEHPARLPHYFLLEDLLVVGSVVKKSLLDLYTTYHGESKSRVLGMNALPTFINRPVWEVSIVRQEDQEKWDQIAEVLGIEIQLVPDRVGMVTPRILFMIMNEAFIMKQEGTAEFEGIDIAMKLGTSYPMGPAEWAQKIGLKNVVEILDLLHHDTGSSRFVPARLLRRMAMAVEKGD